MSFNVKVAKYEVLPPDIYEAELSGVESAETQYGEAAKLSFTILDPDYDGVTVTGLASIPARGIGPGCKLSKWCKALGHDPSGRDDLDLLELIGSPCRLRIENQEKDATTYNKVVDVLPPRRRQAAPDLADVPF